MAATRRFSFRAETDLVQRHNRALVELERLRRESPQLAASVRDDFDARLAAAQDRGLRSSSDGLRATVSALVGAVEQALTDESVEPEPSGFKNDEALAVAQAAADVGVTAI